MIFMSLRFCKQDKYINICLEATMNIDTEMIQMTWKNNIFMGFMFTKQEVVLVVVRLRILVDYFLTATEGLDLFVLVELKTPAA